MSSKCVARRFDNICFYLNLFFKLFFKHCLIKELIVRKPFPISHRIYYAQQNFLYGSAKLGKLIPLAVNTNDIASHYDLTHFRVLIRREETNKHTLYVLVCTKYKLYPIYFSYIIFLLSFFLFEQK